MKKTLLATTLLVALAFSTNASNAFCWGYLNPANWGCPCEKVCKNDCSCKPKCKCKKQTCNPCQKQTCDPCKKQTCDPCQKQVQPCDPCNKIQEMAQ